jgi:rSAM/selenodomain-associated transferase 2
MFLSIIIPTYNEAITIEKLLLYLKECLRDSPHEIIVSDGGSDDGTLDIATKNGALALTSPVKGRAGQMNFGVQHAKGDVYYFVHADSTPVKTFYSDIEKALEKRCDCGSFRFKFDSSKWLLKINAFFTRFNYLFFRGGDQTLFVTQSLWETVGTYDESLLIMEDYDFLERIWKTGTFKLIPKATLVSARKYDTNSWLTVQLANLKVVKMYRKGASQQEMIETYHNFLNYRKNAF